MPVVMRLGAVWRVIFMAGIAWEEDEDLQLPSCPFIDDCADSPEIPQNRILNPANLEIPQNRSNHTPPACLSIASPA